MNRTSDRGSRPTVNSFDVFDTLIARRCISPDGVFARVEREQNVPGFARLRRMAETALAGTAYGLADIYAQLGAMASLSASQAKSLQAAEIEAERAELVPIAENLARVRDGDVLVSDMYLDSATIRGLLELAGLQRHVGLVVTAHGKRVGDIWPRLQDQVSIGLHLGDNVHADIDMPARHGIAAEHTAVSEPTGIEAWFIGVGLSDIAHILREARLGSVAADPVARRLQMIQIQLNAPILLLSSISLLRAAGRLGVGRLLFASRDCNLWLGMFQAMRNSFADAPEAEYFYTSRKARLGASAAYRSYAADRLGKDAMLVDLCGSGWSAALLIEALGQRDRHLFLIRHLAHVPLYQNKVRTPDTCHIHALVGPEQTGIDHVVLEMANYASHGSIVDVRSIDGMILPVLDSDARSAMELQLVDVQRQALASIVAILGRSRLTAVLELADDMIASIVGELCKLLSRETVYFGVFGASHYGEDMRTLQSLDLVG